MGKIPEFKPQPKGPKEIKTKLPKISIGSDMPDDVRQLKNKPKAVAKAQEKKQKSDAKTLAKLPGGKKEKKLKKGTKEYDKMMAELTDIDMKPMPKIKISGTKNVPKKAPKAAKPKSTEPTASSTPTMKHKPKKPKFKNI